MPQASGWTLRTLTPPVIPVRFPFNFLVTQTLQMDLPVHSRKLESCLCGRSFDNLGSLSTHRRLCKKGKKRLGAVLEKAKAIWSQRKRRRLEDLTEYGPLSDRPPKDNESTTTPAEYSESSDVLREYDVVVS